MNYCHLLTNGEFSYREISPFFLNFDFLIFNLIYNYRELCLKKILVANREAKLRYASSVPARNGLLENGSGVF